MRTFFLIWGEIRDPRFYMLFALHVVILSLELDNMLNVGITSLIDFFSGGAPLSLLHRGQLNPAEFVAAGDALVASSPAWRWRSSGAVRKQYLLAEGLPLDVGDEPGNSSTNTNLGTFVDVSTGVGRGIGSSLSSSDPASASGGGVLLAVSIIYNETYKTPHLYIGGTGAGGDPLTPAALLTIVSKDMASATATVERAHPHATVAADTTTPPAAVLAIHPCRHAAVMLAIFEAENEFPNTASYLRLWLRAISGALRVAIDHA